MEQVTGWRKASYSGTNGGACVEAGNTGRGVAVRDTADREGPALAFAPDQWRRFLDGVKAR